MPRVVLARHGDAEGEASHRLIGRADVDLTATGLAQAAALADRVAELGITALVTSPLRRARHTAEQIGRALGLDPVIEDDLTDLDTGRLTGTTLDELMRHDPAAYAAWLDAPETLDFPDGETLAALRVRVGVAIERLLDADPEEANLLVVTHEHVARSLLTLLLGLGPEAHFQIDVDAGSISVFERRADQFYLTLLNETCHLQGGAPHLVPAHQ
ncbi:MAG TPA: histidine phosphatase family protein [Dehalococcoidia bacterium]|nr:histidine phosphatase family protein [Dehalococcoidia bacterium]